MDRSRGPLSSLTVALVLFAYACGSSAATPSLAPPTLAPTPTPTLAPTRAPTPAPHPVFRIAMTFPRQGTERDASQPIINGARLALKEARGKVGKYLVEMPDSLILDDSFHGVHDPQTGLANMLKIVDDPLVIGVVGPFNSSVARAQIPESNAAGLAQCSPSTTNPAITKGLDALALRTKPNNFVRVMVPDDLEGPAAARYVFETLGKKRAYVVDDGEEFGTESSSGFIAAFKALGGTVTGHDSIPRGSETYVSLLKEAKATKPTAIFFGGTTTSGAANVLLAAKEAGLGSLPFVSDDGIYDGSFGTPGSFLSLVGGAAAHSSLMLSGQTNVPNWDDFNGRYRDAYGSDAYGLAAQGYACVQVLLDALSRALIANPDFDLAKLRSAVTEAITDTTHTYVTSLGTMRFDANGDTSLTVVTVLSYDADTHDWRYEAEITVPPS